MHDQEIASRKLPFQGTSPGRVVYERQVVTHADQHPALRITDVTQGKGKD